MQLVKPAIVSVLIAIAGAAAGCVVTPGTVTYSGSAGIYPDTTVTTNTGREPVLHSITPSVTTVDANGQVTFTVVANAPSGRPLQYNWSATSGLLSGTSGQVVSWRPMRNADGSLTAGIATITVILSDGQYATTGTVNIQVTGNGATVLGAGTAASPTPAPAASATPAPAATPTAAPSATPTPAASATATPAATASADAAATSDATATADAAATH
jgi:hypothetical protein